MLEPTADPQAGNASTNPQPQAGATPTPEPQAGDGNTETISLDEAKKLRSEAANLRKRLKAFEDAEEERKQAQLSDYQKLEQQHAALQARYASELREKQEQLTLSEIQRVAGQLGVINPALAARALDTAEIEYDEKGAPTNIDALLKALVKENPYLVPQQGQQSRQAAPGNSPNPRPTANTPDSMRDKFLNQMRSSGKYGA